MFQGMVTEKRAVAQIGFSGMHNHESREATPLAAQNLFSTILKPGFAANPKLALRAQTVEFAGAPPS